jgi:hypothetical protein
MLMVPEKKESENVQSGHKQASSLNRLEVGIIDFFVQMSRLLPEEKALVAAARSASSSPK